MTRGIIWAWHVYILKKIKKTKKIKKNQKKSKKNQKKIKKITKWHVAVTVHIR